MFFFKNGAIQFGGAYRRFLNNEDDVTLPVFRARTIFVPPFFRQEWPAMPIIAMTGGSPTGKTDEYLSVATVAGANVTLRKPFGAQTLLESLSSL